MLLGAHLANGPLTDADWTALALLRPTAVTTMGQHHGADVYERLETYSRPLYLVRCEPDYSAALHAWSNVPLSVRQAGRALLRFGNEPNIEGPDAATYTARFISTKLALQAPMLTANLCLQPGWQTYLHGIARAIELSDGIALSLYRDDASDPSRWLYAYQTYNKPMYAVELGVDYERGERRAEWVRWVLPGLEAVGVRAATVFILGGYPGGAWWDGWILSPVEIDGLARVIAEQGEVAKVNLSVAVITSNQDRNLGAIADYNEAGGCQQIGYRVRDRLTAKGVTVRYVVPPLESTDDVNHTHLKSAFTEAYTWLNGQVAQGRAGCALHLHTNAARTPQEGTSHTGYCHTSRVAKGKPLGTAICQRIGATLGLPVVEYDYTGKGYLFETLFGTLPSVLIEVTRHDRRPDLEALYGRVDAVADAITEGIVAWGQPDPRDARIKDLEAEVASLRAKVVQAVAILGSIV